MKIKYIIALLFVAILFCNCEKTIDFEGKNMEPKIVVNGVLSPNQIISATISTSRSLLSEKKYFESLENATADLYVDDVFVETLNYEGRIDTVVEYLQYDVIRKNPYNKGSYVGHTIAETGKTYRLEVSSANLKSVSCETTIPFPVEIIALDTFKEIYTSEYGTHEILHTTMRFKDPENKVNYYRVQLDVTQGNVLTHYNNNNEYVEIPDTILVQNSYGNGVDNSDPIYKASENEANDIVMGAPTNSYSIFDDSQINGNEYELKTRLSSHTMDEELMAKGNFIKRKLKLFSLSKTYFDYLNTCNYHYWYSDDYFSEPVPVYSNVKGGMGIWGSSSSSEFIIGQGTYPMPGKTYVDVDDYYQNSYGGYGVNYSY